MKTIITTLIIILSYPFLAAQTAPLSEWFFSTQVAEYESLDTENLLPEGDYVYHELTVPIGFDFQLEDDLFSELSINTHGTIRLNLPDFEAFYFISGFGGIYKQHPVLEQAIRHKTIGTDGARQCIIEFQNMQPHGSSEETDQVNFQVILHEGSNRITFHYGEIVISDWSVFELTQSVEIAAYRVDGITEEYRGLFLGGDDDIEPYPFVGSFPSAEMVVTGIPETGTQYWFSTTDMTTTTTAVFDSVKAFTLAPNPARQHTQVNFTLATPSPVEIRLFNLAGQPVRTESTGQMPAGAHQLNLNLNDLPTGIYLLQLQAGNEQQTQRLLIENR